MEKGFTVWFTGVPASGKTTIAMEVELRLKDRGIKVENLDSDKVRANISPNLGYTLEARDENTKRLAFLSNILCRNGVCTLVAAVSSLRSFRDRARGMIDNFVEVWVRCPLEECQRRDPKGLYARAERGEINDIAGLHQPYQEPANADVILDTLGTTPQECAIEVIDKLEELGYLEPDDAYTQDEREEIKERLSDLGYI